MPRLPRIYIKEAVNFITCRGEHNETIFKDPEDYTMFLDLMKRYQEQYGIKVFAFCLMPDHLHLLVEIEKSLENPPSEEPVRSQNISDFMHDLNNNYTKYFNGRYGRKGHLFRERFKSALIEKQTSLLKMTAYLHLNPQRSGLTEDARIYPYSSFQMYLYDQAVNEQDLGFMRQAVNEALGFLNSKSYADFIAELTPEEGHIIHKRLQRGGVLGSDDFIKKVKEAVQAYQSSGEVQKYEIEDKKNFRLYFTVGGLVLVLLASAGSVYFISLKQPVTALQQAAPLKNILDEFKSTQWQIKLIPLSGSGESGDILSFADGRFVSARLQGLGFPATGYSVSLVDNRKIVWETMQNTDRGQAAWRGEIQNNTMSGALSLRETGKEPQDFTFISIGQRRNIQ